MQKDILNNYKYIVSSGCSYGLLTDFVMRPFSNHPKLYHLYNDEWHEKSDDVVVINAMIASQGAEWQADSIITICSRLLKIGIDSNNIYVILEWSQADRISISPFNVLNLDYKKLDLSNEQTYVDFIQKHNSLARNNHELIIFLRDYLNIKESKKIHNIGSIDEKIYINPSHSRVKYFEEIGNDFEFFIKEAQKIEEQIPIETKIKSYIDNILRTQYYLKLYNISYNFFFMQSTLSGWIKQNGVIKNKLSYNSPIHHVQHYDSVIKKIICHYQYNPKNEIESDIENNFIETKFQISEIDFSKIWFYENEKYRRGGIDEYSIDVFKESAYVKITENRHELDISDIMCNYGMHPNMVVYLNLWNKVTSNCNFLKLKTTFLDFINEKYWEDYNLEIGKTKNFITFSKNYLNQFTISDKENLV